MKTCTRCGVEKGLTEFNKKCDTKDGFNARCRDCISIVSRASRAVDPDKSRAKEKVYRAANSERRSAHSRAFYANNSETILAGKRAEYAADPEKYLSPRRATRVADPEPYRAKQRAYRAANLDKFRDRANAYYAANPERYRAKQRAYHAANPGKRRALYRKWAKSNRGKLNNHNARYRSIKLQRTFGDDPRIEALYEIAGWLRAHGDKVEIDHIVPLKPADPNSALGLHVYVNLQILSAYENRSKGNRNTP